MEAKKFTYEELERQIENLKQQLERLNSHTDTEFSNEIDFEEIIKNSLDLILIQNPKGTITFIGPQVEKVTGHKADTWLSQKIPDYIHPDDVEETLSKSSLALTGEKVVEYEFRLYDLRGGLIWLSQTAIPIYKDGQMVYIQNHIKNITQLKQFEQELDKAKIKADEDKQRYKNIVTILPDGVVIHQNGLIVYANQAAGAIMKAKNPDQLLNMPVINFVHPDYRAIALQRIKQSLDSKTTANTIEEVFIGFDQKPLNVLVTAIPFQFNEKPSMLTVFTDISKLKTIEAELTKSKIEAEMNAVLLKNIADNIPAFIAAVDVNTLRYKFANKRYSVGFNKPHQQIIGAHINDIIGKANADFAMSYINDVRQGKTTSYINTFKLVEGERHVQVEFVPGYDDAGILRDIIVLSQDITTAKNKELELQRAKEKAEESDLLKTAFLQNMSHEIRTPMNAIVGFSGLLNNPDVSEDKRKSFVSIIQNSTNQLLSIISDILSISSIETNQVKANLEPVCINNILIDLLAIFKSQAYNRNIAIYLHKELTDEQSEIYTDRTKFTQIMTNLLSNAMKFTHQGYIEFGYRLMGNNLEFFVKDSGIGIESDMQSRIFERFRQANNDINRKYGGTGLGLAISKAYAELLNGSMRVVSETGKGSTFILVLPYKSIHAIDTSFHFEGLKQPTVLVAEDEEFNFLYLEELLTNWDLAVIHAKNGQEAIDFCDTKPGIDIILMDIKMPGVDGYTAAIEIKKHRPQLPIIAQSAYALDHERKKFDENIFDHYLTKPMSKNNLKSVLSNYIRVKDD